MVGTTENTDNLDDRVVASNQIVTKYISETA